MICTKKCFHVLSVKLHINPLMYNVPKWSDTLKILQQMLQDFQSVSDHFGTLCIKRLKRFKAGCSSAYSAPNC